ncbi:MAG TPA: hypothetical protein VG122_07090, partial [Gemmata sp.]|nr:hypothetical protein [Gemmata sp.]
MKIKRDTWLQQALNVERTTIQRFGDHITIQERKLAGNCAENTSPFLAKYTRLLEKGFELGTHPTWNATDLPELVGGGVHQ